MSDITRVSPGSPEHGMLGRAITAYRGDLESARTTIALEFAAISDEERAKGRGAVRCKGGGWAIARVRVTGEKERRYGCPDAVVTFDRWHWDRLGDRSRFAALHHELYKLVLDRDSGGVIKYDKCLRPKLKLRPYDVQVGWFRDVAECHGDDAVEVIQARQLIENPDNAQAFFGFMANSLVSFDTEADPNQTTALAGSSA